MVAGESLDELLERGMGKPERKTLEETIAEFEDAVRTLHDMQNSPEHYTRMAMYDQECKVDVLRDDILHHRGCTCSR